jgi:predicted nucleotide-binding protein
MTTQSSIPFARTRSSRLLTAIVVRTEGNKPKMPRAPRSATPPTPPSPPALRIPRPEAAAKIQAQINEGEALLGAQPRSERELNDANEQRGIWSDYNRELLSQIFTTPAVADEYSSFTGGVISMNPSFGELVQEFRDSVQSSLTRLRSIYRRLDLFPAPDEQPVTPRRAREPRAGSSVFLVHGHNDAAKEAVARFLERLGVPVIILHEQPDKGRTIIEKFEAYSEVRYAVVLITGDDVGGSRSTPTALQPRGRQNVILELGYFLGALGRTHVCALKEEGVEVPSDLSGVLYVPLDPAGAWKLRLAGEMKAAGLEVDLNRAL